MQNFKTGKGNFSFMQVLGRLSILLWPQVCMCVSRTIIQSICDETKIAVVLIASLMYTDMNWLNIKVYKEHFHYDALGMPFVYSMTLCCMKKISPNCKWLLLSLIAKAIQADCCVSGMWMSCHRHMFAVIEVFCTCQWCDRVCRLHDRIPLRTEYCT